MNVEALEAELREHAGNWPNRAEYYAARGADLAETAADALASERSRADRLEKALTAARELIDVVAGENRPAREWAVKLRNEIDAALSGNGGSRG